MDTLKWFVGHWATLALVGVAAYFFITRVLDRWTDRRYRNRQPLTPPSNGTKTISENGDGGYAV